MPKTRVFGNGLIEDSRGISASAKDGRVLVYLRQGSRSTALHP
jgi:hypothetical protein